MDQRREPSVGGSGDTSNMRSTVAALTPDPFAMLADRHPALIYVGTDSTFYRLDVGSGPDDPRESALADALLALAAKRGRA